MSGKVYAVASGKGGVGKTTTVVNLGVTLRADDHSVALVDADLGMANLGTFLGIDHEPTLHEVLADEATIDEAMTEQAERFGILPGARDLHQYAAADPAGLGPVLEELAERYEYVLVDTGAGVGYDDVLPLELVDEVILVATPDGAAIGDAGKTAEISDLVDVTVRGVVLTRTDEDDDADAIARRMGVDLLASIPEDPVVPESTARGRPLEASAPESGAADGYRRLAATLTGRNVERFEPPETAVESAAEHDTGTASDPSGDGTEDVDVEREDAADAGIDGGETASAEEDEIDSGGTEVDANADAPDVAAADDEVTRDDAAVEDDEPIDGPAEADDDTGEETDGDSTDESEGSGGLLSRLGGLFG